MEKQQKVPHIKEELKQSFEKMNITAGDELSEDLPVGKFYVMPHMTDDWEKLSKGLAPLVEGKLNFQDVVKIIGDNILQFQKKGSDVNLSVLESFFTSLKNEEKLEFETQVLPGLAKLALNTPNLFPNKVRILVQENNSKVCLSKEQCACLLANMFLCTTVDQNNPKLPPGFNFSKMFSSDPIVAVNKLRCIFHYFRRVLQNLQPSIITFERLVLNKDIHGDYTLEGWKNCQDILRKVEVRPHGRIEDAIGSVEIDFANKYLGGLVLRAMATQEDILFVTNPELIVGILFTEVMKDQEAISMRGAERYSEYQGYLETFTFHSEYQDTRPKLPDGNLDREIVAIDAINFNEYRVAPQYSENGVMRELNKAYVGFFGNASCANKTDNKPISTGKWGCGIFQGDPQLKLVIQWLAASRTHRDLLFHSFGDQLSFKQVEAILSFYTGKTVGELVQDMLRWCEEKNRSKMYVERLFNALKQFRSIP